MWNDHLVALRIDTKQRRKYLNLSINGNRAHLQPDSD